MEHDNIDDEKVQKADCACVFDIPDQTVKSLSRILYVGTVVELLLVIGWVIMYRYMKWDAGVEPAQSTITETIILVMLVVGLSAAFGLYGLLAKDRGFLLAAAICQMILLNTVHPFFPDARLKAYSGVICAVVLLVCWMFFRTEEKIEADNVANHRLGIRIVFSCFDLPNQTPSSLRKWIFLFSFLVAGIGAALVGIGTRLVSGAGYRNVIMLGGSMMLSAAAAALGGVLQNRIVLTFAFILALYDIAKVNMYFTNLANLKNSADPSSLEHQLLRACIALYYIAIVVVASHSWVCIRLAEKLQVMDIEKMRNGNGLVSHGCCGRTMAATPALVTRVIGITSVIQLFIAVACVSLAARSGAQSVAEFIDFNIFLAVVVVVACVAVLYGVWALDKGWLLFYALLQIWVLAQSWRSWQSTMTFLASFPNTADKGYIAYIVLIIVYWIVAVVGSSMAIFLSETLIDLDVVAEDRESGSESSDNFSTSVMSGSGRRSRRDASRTSLLSGSSRRSGASKTGTSAVKMTRTGTGVETGGESAVTEIVTDEASRIKPSGDVEATYY
jgi:hypothetical protein